MRQIIYKEVKRPGRNYDRLLELLKELHGPADIRQQYILGMQAAFSDTSKIEARQCLAKFIELTCQHTYTTYIHNLTKKIY